MKKECKIVQDLLPSYVDKLTNEETNQYIEEHLKECKECQKVLENMKSNIEYKEQDDDRKKVKYFKKYKINNNRFVGSICSKKYYHSKSNGKKSK